MADDAKKTILARRARFIAAAMASATIGIAAPLGACGGETDGPSTSDASSEGNPQPCLTQKPPEDGGRDAISEPQVCLTAPLDSGRNDDATPQPCLSPQPPDSGGQ
jgi:hypothetical protein